ncbi:Protein N-acetyltransferase, RimJ/RimL family [Duganella sp. CF402]|uniref:GNAT family N-acetyltransferase n=1 Tax=unclassified Duganella TaxID=2636909 RepID=UPI0008AE1EC2|nr:MULTISPECIES: GNAT family N-acetyltransferase [unclassified Duganella]RZT10928.1 RimJ/RimL family protein N-acetyltransferase [Duganella sp. BK701]SEK89640.1 Protein N-acetyltransferase, RimJ/RimL family [Duganella sp. CF402]
MNIKLPEELPTLQTRRVELRSMVYSDSLALYEIYSDPTVMRYTDETPFESLVTVSVMLNSIEMLLREGKSLEWGIVVKSSKKLVGTCGLHRFNESLQMAEIGCLLNVSAWGYGYMAEALGLIISYARDVVRLKRLAADVSNENEPAQRLFTSLGFHRVGLESWEMPIALSV